MPPEWAPSVFVPLTGLVLPAVAMATLFTYIEKVRRNFSSSGNRKYGGGDGVGGGDFDRVMLVMVVLTVRLGPVQQQRLPYMSSVVCPWPALPLPVLTN